MEETNKVNINVSEELTKKENDYQSLDLDSIIIENKIVENNINTSNYKYVSNNSNMNENFCINRCDSCACSSSSGSSSSSSSQRKSNSSCNSKTPINRDNNDDGEECDIINNSFLNKNASSSETIISKESSSSSLHNSLYNEKQELNQTNTNNDNIVFINDENNNIISTIQNDNMTTISNGSNNFNDLTRQELEPTHVAWNSWKLWCLIKLLFSVLIILFGARGLIIDYSKTCYNNFIFFSLCYIVISTIQIIINILLIVYLPHKIYQINYSMHRRLYISKVLWLIQGFIDVLQLIMIPIGIRILKGASNICFDGIRTYPSSSYDFIYYITLISSCIYVLFVSLILILPCWTLFILLPKYEGVSMSQFKKINTIEVTNAVIEQEPFCVICMEEFKLKSKVKQLPCNHIYHKKCISIWFAEHNKCPTCRYEIE
ncbi:hypothetical protein BCR32DRAFT_296680 [Anaeromyces robustus]|uniref:RING-type domain-containing protein n=1 Tax=Anaeromyces robustus TaxID=1754192 RepID=A0A1Y1WQF8_9FUNG|nr:hypothetical protein BCR32DRAFT_296680 [Anaeromyces robustus]|eukprot:ORX75773.1 hypothetical protein BCR32DRAFT_296680 [Anaeromyces robustus]